MRGGGQNLRFFSQYVALSQYWCEIGPRLVLTTNRKLYIGSRLPLRSMTLDDIERKNRGF